MQDQFLSGKKVIVQVRSLVRRARSAEPGKGGRKKEKKGKGKGRGKGKGGKNGKGKGNKKRKGGKGGKGGKNGRNNRQNGEKKKKKDEKDKKEGRNGKSSDLLPDFVYNQLWCFDLAMEQVTFFNLQCLVHLFCIRVLYEPNFELVTHFLHLVGPKMILS